MSSELFCREDCTVEIEQSLFNDSPDSLFFGSPPACPAVGLAVSQCTGEKQNYKNPYYWSPPPGGRRHEIPIGRNGVMRLVHHKCAESLPHKGDCDSDDASLKVSNAHRKSSKLQSQIAEAVGFQKALELRKHVDNKPWADGVMLWLGSSGAQLYWLDWDPGMYTNGF